jgi:methylated-DNA-[protein]-cysteine S-methyltransferase
MRARVEISAAAVRTPKGKIWILATGDGLREIRLGGERGVAPAEVRARGLRVVHRAPWTDPARRALEDYLAGRATEFDLALDLDVGTPFQRRVWAAARKIPYGHVVSYGELARMAGSPAAFRAVGNALGANPVPIVVPCHRVIHDDRSIGGFSSGLTWKRFLLEIERGQLEFAWKPRRRTAAAR